MGAEPEPQPEDGEAQDGDSDPDPTLHDIWTKSIDQSAAEVAQSNQLLLNKLCTVGRDHMGLLWDNAAVPISKTTVRSIEGDKLDPEVTAALWKHKRLYALLHADLSAIYKQQAETTGRVHKSMQIVQELSVKVGEKGDLDEAAQNELDDLQSQHCPATD